MRAMCNCGLALFFLAQLIAYIGPAAACDANEDFLAEIDEFDAMMSKTLFRWGSALQLRSHMRPRNSKDKGKLLQQAEGFMKMHLSLILTIC